MILDSFDDAFGRAPAIAETISLHQTSKLRFQSDNALFHSDTRENLTANDAKCAEMTEEAGIRRRAPLSSILSWRPWRLLKIIVHPWFITSFNSSARSKRNLL